MKGRRVGSATWEERGAVADSVVGVETAIINGT